MSTHSQGPHSKSHGAPTDESAHEPARWLDDPRNVDKIVRALYIVCAVVVLLDLTYAKHGHYAFESIIGFHAVYGFLSCVGLVIAATWMRKLVMRSEDYYDDGPEEEPLGDPGDDDYVAAGGEHGHD